jgi:hypothetical protein
MTVSPVKPQARSGSCPGLSNLLDLPRSGGRLRHQTSRGLDAGGGQSRGHDVSIEAISLRVWPPEKTAEIAPPLGCGSALKEAAALDTARCRERVSIERRPVVTHNTKGVLSHSVPSASRIAAAHIHSVHVCIEIAERVRRAGNFESACPAPAASGPCTAWKATSAKNGLPSPRDTNKRDRSLREEFCVVARLPVYSSSPRCVRSRRRAQQL